jgi:hypothetical protein
MLRVGIFTLECLFSGIYLWLGLYLITRAHVEHDGSTRRWWQRPALSTGLALLSVACYLLGLAIQILLEDVEAVNRWQRLAYWAQPMGCAFIFHGILLVTGHEGRSRRLQLAGHFFSFCLFVGAICLALMSSLTDLVYRYEATRRLSRPPYFFEVPPRYPWYALIVVYILGALLVMTFMPLRRYLALADESRRPFRWIAIAGALQTAGAAVGITALSLPELHLPAELGDATLALGITLLGYGVAQHNAVFQHQVITRDFYRSLTGAVVTSVTSVAAFAGAHTLARSAMTPESIPLLVWLAIFTITLAPWLSSQLDRLFLSPAAAAARLAFSQASEQLSVTEEQQLPETLTGMRKDLELRELAATIARDVEGLFYRTNYTREGGGDYISLNTGLLHLVAVEEAATALMLEEGVSPAVDRQYYQLKAFRQLIDTLITAMLEDAVATTQGDATDSDRRNRLLARATILQQQFIQDVPRATVQRTIVRKYGVGDGGGYGRLLAAAKKDLAHHLYLAERRARESTPSRELSGVREG